jgi:3-hydroxyisobutyrate dehydrogenase-like beta-hydroxyacid dehydrogenase
LLIVDCSTSDPSVTTALAAELAGRGVTLIDAPLSRTPKDAWEGTLDVMIGGAEEDVARVKPIIASFSQRMVHTGPTGTGHTMKLLNNFVSLGYGALYAEALMLGAKSGLKAEIFDQVIRGGRMDCGFYQTFFKYVIERDRDAHKFTLRNALKDLTYLSAFATNAGAANPVSAAVRNAYALAIGAGRGDDYVPMLSDIVAELNGIGPENS